MTKLKQAGLYLLIAGYLVAGINHFVHPAFYIAIIPNYIPLPVLMNTLAGCFEILLAIMLIFSKSRPLAAWGVVLMLAAFMPVHISMVNKPPYHSGSLNIKVWMAWLRLALQPALMYWAWIYTIHPAKPTKLRGQNPASSY